MADFVTPGLVRPAPRLAPRRPDLKAVADAKTAAAEQLAELREQIALLESQESLLQRQEAAGKARQDLLAFTRFTMPDPSDPDDVCKSAYKAAGFHEEVAEALMAVERGEITKLIFCMPPRHGKTELATKRLAAWYSGRHPDHNIAVGAYSDTIAEDMGSDVRAILASAQFRQIFPFYRLRRGGNAKANIQTDRGGRLVFVGRGGALTGRGAHLMLIDDLYKDHEEARSPTIRDQAWNWFTKVAMTRLMGKKLVIIVMTRWHSDDIIGRLTDPNNPHYSAAQAARWKIIRLPALAEDDDVLGRAPGEALWPDGPDQYDEDYLQEKMELDPLGFAALYQQTPTVADGILFKKEHFQYYRQEQLPKDLRYYCASDHAVGLKQRNDPSCLIKVGVDIHDNIYVLECDWRKMRTDVAVEAMLSMASGPTAPLIWWAEKGHISMSIGPFLSKRMLETGTYINMREMNPAGDKEQRAQSVAARNATGKIYFPADKFWTAKAVDQCLAFPNGINDDFVDAFAYIGLGLQSQFGASKPKPKPKPPAFGTLAWVRYNDSWQRDKAKADNVGRFT